MEKVTDHEGIRGKRTVTRVPAQLQCTARTERESSFTEEEWKIIESSSTARPMKKKELLYQQGLRDDNIYILRTGIVKLSKLNSTGHELILDIISGNTILGMMHNSEREKEESAVALQEGFTYMMSEDDFDSVMKKAPEVMAKIREIMLLRKVRIENKLFALFYRTVKQRLAHAILALLDDFSLPCENGQRLRINLTHKDYANLIASTREVVTATISKFRREGIIRYQGKQMIIDSIDNLVDVVNNN
jgi:CRP/FNR family transcriptional regulator